MDWCPKAEFLILHEKHFLYVQNLVTHTDFRLDVLSFILHAIMTNKASL